MVREEKIPLEDVLRRHPDFFVGYVLVHQSYLDTLKAQAARRGGRGRAAEEVKKGLKLGTVAKRWDVCVKTVQRMVTDGTLKTFRAGRTVLARVESVEAIEARGDVTKLLRRSRPRRKDKV